MFLFSIFILLLTQLDAVVCRLRVRDEDAVECSHFLGPEERVAFVKVVMRLVERGQYSKNVSLAACAANVAARLTYLEPYVVLPLIVSCFQMAMDTVSIFLKFFYP